MNKLFKIKDENGTIIPKNIFWPAFFGVLAVCVLYVVIMFFVPVKAPVNMESRGAFGDMFGAVGAFFSGMAFWGVFVTMYLQRETLRIQKNEIETQKKDSEEAKSISKKHDFEYSFFILLDRQIRIRDRFYFKFGKIKFEGLRAMNKAYNLFCDYVTKMNKYGEDKDYATAKRKYIDYIETKLGFSENEQEQKKGIALPTGKPSFFEDYLKYYMAIFKHTSLKQYAASLIQICEYVESCEVLDEEERKYYMRFLGNQITRMESCVLLYYAFALKKKTDGIEDERLINYLVKYSLLEQLERKDLVEDYHFDEWLEVKGQK